MIRPEPGKGTGGRHWPHVAHGPAPGRTPRRGPRVPYPVGRGDADDELDGLLHVEPAVPAHHQGGLLPLRRLHRGDDTLDEILRVVGAALEHLHPLPQPARARLLVRVRPGLNGHDLHHGGDLFPGAGANCAHEGGDRSSSYSCSGVRARAGQGQRRRLSRPRTALLLKGTGDRALPPPPVHLLADFGGRGKGESTPPGLRRSGWSLSDLPSPPRHRPL